jgi:hypothetical protein
VLDGQSVRQRRHVPGRVAKRENETFDRTFSPRIHLDVNKLAGEYLVISLHHICRCDIVVFIRAIRCIRVPMHDVLIAASAARTNAFYRVSPFRILACCCFYFPTTMVLMYCYGSAFHVNKLRLKRVVCVNTPEVVSGGHIERVSQAYSFRVYAISSGVRLPTKLMSHRMRNVNGVYDR